MWQHPPSGPHRQTNDHLRAAGSGPMDRPPGGPPFPGATMSSGGPSRSNPNRLPLVLAGVAAVLLILIVLVFVVAL